MLSEQQFKVIEVLVKFPVRSLYETVYGGVSMIAMLKTVFTHKGWIEDPLVIFKDLEKMQYITNNNGLYEFNKLCTCGRCSRWVNRNKEVKVLSSREGRTLNYTKEILFGKELNWTDYDQAPVMIGAQLIEEPAPTPVKCKLSKQRKPKTGLVMAKAWNEANKTRLKKDRLLGRAEELEQRAAELRKRAS